MQYVREGPVGWAGLNQCLLIETLSPDPGLASIYVLPGCRFGEFLLFMN
jgi:hypothetical protein